MLKKMLLFIGIKLGSHSFLGGRSAIELLKSTPSPFKLTSILTAVFFAAVYSSENEFWTSPKGTHSSSTQAPIGKPPLIGFTKGIR
jgi:hypothetical protein